MRRVRQVRQGVPWGTRKPNAWGQPGSCASLQDAALPQLADPGISGMHVGECQRLCAILFSMQQKRAYRYRFYPTPEQAAVVARTFGCGRYV